MEINVLVVANLESWIIILMLVKYDESEHIVQIYTFTKCVIIIIIICLVYISQN